MAPGIARAWGGRGRKTMGPPRSPCGFRDTRAVRHHDPFGLAIASRMSPSQPASIAKLTARATRMTAAIQVKPSFKPASGLFMGFSRWFIRRPPATAILPARCASGRLNLAPKLNPTPSPKSLPRQRTGAHIRKSWASSGGNPPKRRESLTSPLPRARLRPAGDYVADGPNGQGTSSSTLAVTSR